MARQLFPESRIPPRPIATFTSSTAGLQQGQQLHGQPGVYFVSLGSGGSIILQFTIAPHGSSDSLAIFTLRIAHARTRSSISARTASTGFRRQVLGSTAVSTSDRFGFGPSIFYFVGSRTI
jgi:hypothetical protein